MRPILQLDRDDNMNCHQNKVLADSVEDFPAPSQETCETKVIHPHRPEHAARAEAASLRASRLRCCLPADPLLAAYNPCTFPTRKTNQSAARRPCRPHLRVQRRSARDASRDRPDPPVGRPPRSSERRRVPRRLRRTLSRVIHGRPMIRCPALPTLKLCVCRKVSKVGWRNALSGQSIFRTVRCGQLLN